MFMLEVITQTALLGGYDCAIKLKVWPTADEVMYTRSMVQFR